MSKFKRIDIAGLMLGFMLSVMAGVAGSVTFKSVGTSTASCPGDVTIEASGVVKCTSTGGVLLSACTGEVVIDSTGTVRCTGSLLVVPVCTLVAAPSSISSGGSSKLTVSCTPAATSYVWSGTPVGFGTTTTSSNVSPTSTTSYSVKGTNAAGTGNSASVAVTVASSGGSAAPAAPVSAAPACTLTQSNFQGFLALSANCNPAATSYNWSANTTFASTQPNGLVSPPAVTTTYTVAGINAIGTGNTATLTINVTTPTPTCTLVANPASVDANGSSILTASCNPAATSYAWTGGTCVGNATNTCTVSLAAGSQAYTVTGHNNAGDGNAASTTVTVAAPSCTLTANPASIAPNGSSTLTVDCSATPTSYTWTGGTCAGNATNTCTVSLPTGSQTYTVTGTNGVGTGSAANATVTVAVPNCTLAASPAAVARGGASTLTATCSPAAGTSYVWTGGTCAGNATATCNVTPGSTTAYTVQGTNAAGAGNAASATVTATAPSCTLTASPSTIAPNGSSTLTASCNPVATNGYTWTGGTCAGNATATCTVSLAAGSQTYTVTGNDLTGPGTAASATVAVVADAGCPNGYTYTVVPVTWISGVSIGGPLQTMNHCEVKAFQVTNMPARSYALSETVYADVVKYMSISQTPFDFSPALEAAGCAGGYFNNPQLTNSTTARPGACSVVQGATYYFNVRNALSRDGADACPAGHTCQFYLSW